MKPHRREEVKLRKQGHRHIAGVDEAGRGSLAGPIVAGAVILPFAFRAKNINDSKVLSAKQREALFVYITQSAVAWAVGVVSAEEIDRDGIQAANARAMQSALKKLHIQPDAILVDALPITFLNRPVKPIIDGDAKVVSIAAASIVAKVVRDALMLGEHRRWPQYGFAQHKGYGTKLHHRMIKKHGPSPIHRKSFAPLKTTLSARRKKR